jgi:hypothetical protein
MNKVLVNPVLSFVKSLKKVITKKIQFRITLQTSLVPFPCFR